MGSFSDGKTSAIAGLLGQVQDNMIIDQDESSDDLAIYRFDGIDNVEIIDTPGLFGTKEKEVDGKNIRYSEITNRYISEADIVVYVCDAVTPLKDSHIGIIRRVLREYGKMKSTVFVLNKMDEAGFDLLDSEDFKRGEEIKRQALIIRLKDTMDLSCEEEKNLHIVCIAADPKGKGLGYWLSKKDSYNERSHIGLLQDTISEIVELSDIEELKKDTNTAVITDVVSKAEQQLSTIVLPIEEAVKSAREISNDLLLDKSGLRRELIAAKVRLVEDLQLLSSTIKIEIDESDQASFTSLLENKLGLVDGTLDFNILDTKIELTISQYVESNNYAIQTRVEEYSEKISAAESIIKDALKMGAGKLGKVSITNTQVLKVRDTLAKSFKWAGKVKFKPYGAGKLASKITKAAGHAAIIINVGTDLFSYFKEKRDAKKFNELKATIKNHISSKFQKLFDVLKTDDSYFQEFAPSYLELCKLVDQRNAELIQLQNQVQQLRQYNDQLKEWIINN